MKTKMPEFNNISILKQHLQNEIKIENEIFISYIYIFMFAIINEVRKQGNTLSILAARF